MPQYTFTSDELFIKEIDSIASSEKRSRSEMIVILLNRQIKERNRKRNAKKDNTTHQS